MNREKQEKVASAAWNRLNLVSIKIHSRATFNAPNGKLIRVNYKLVRSIPPRPHSASPDNFSKTLTNIYGSTLLCRTPKKNKKEKNIVSTLQFEKNLYPREKIHMFPHHVCCKYFSIVTSIGTFFATRVVGVAKRRNRQGNRR